jgi:phenylalanyl-tRNA synthetase beta chain
MLGYSILESKNQTFFPGKQCEVLYKNKEVGHFGTIHPNVLSHFGWKHPVSCVELNLEML